MNLLFILQCEFVSFNLKTWFYTLLNKNTITLFKVNLIFFLNKYDLQVQRGKLKAG